MATQEQILHYAWKYQLYAEPEWTTTDGEQLRVITPGIHNTDAGPDFFNAKVQLDDITWVGNVEIHGRSSDWLRHGHDTNPAYDSVILHVVGEADTPVRRTDGSLIPQVVVRVPERVVRSIDWLLSREQAVPCIDRLSELDDRLLYGWLSALVGERLKRKTNDIFRRLERTHNDWNETFYITLSRNFGFGTNSDAFEWLASGLPFKYICKQRHSTVQIEALLFGQAGMLSDARNDAYYRTLQREYHFLRTKYSLRPIDAHLFKNFRTRPLNFPHLRVAQLASVWAHNDTLFSEILEDPSADRLCRCFDVPLSAYWNTHFHFDYPSPPHKSTLGPAAARLMLINTVVPILYAYGLQKNVPEYCERAERLLDSLPPERNAVIRPFTEAGIRARNASDSQALLQLRREYCEPKRCLSCRIAFSLIKHSLA